MVPDAAEKEAGVNKTVAGESNNGLMQSGHAAVVNYYNQCSDTRAFEVGTPLIGRHANAAGNNCEVAPPTPIQLGNARTFNITDTDATSAETEIKNAEIDLVLSDSSEAINNGTDLRNSYSGEEKYYSNAYPQPTQQKNRQVNTARQEASIN